MKPRSTKNGTGKAKNKAVGLRPPTKKKGKKGVKKRIKKSTKPYHEGRGGCVNSR